MDDNGNILQLPSWDESPTLQETGGGAPDFLKDDDWFGTDIDQDILDFAEPYRPPRYTLERKGVQFADVGDLHIVTGKPGHGKTGLVSQIMAAILCGQFGNTTYCLKERPEPVLLYIDTEQGKDDTIAIKNRVCTLAGMPYDKPTKRFIILRLRDTDLASDRWKKILKSIYVFKPTDIFLDGMLDIVKDYNDQVECQPVVRKCMKIATQYDASLWAVLHENPMVDKLVGTLGSIVQRKVSEIFAVRKIKQCDLKPQDRRSDLPDIYFEVKQLKARGRDADDWKFEYQTNAGGWGMPVEIDADNSISSDSKAVQEKLSIKEADEAFKQYSWTASGARWTDLDRFFRSKGITSTSKISDLFNIAVENGIIFKDDKRKYHYNGLKNTMPNDKPEDLPFEQPNNDVPF